jgi:uncharacterized protein
MGIEFGWDQEKARSNLITHGVGFEEATTVFADPVSLTIPDPGHSWSEDERFVTPGLPINERTPVVVHGDVEDLIRIISARSATRREQTADEAS